MRFPVAHDGVMQPEPSPPGSSGTAADVLRPATGTDVPAPRLTVAAAARRLGIAPATLRTWDRRYGIGPSEHTPGRHRRYSDDDIARLELMQRALVRGAAPADAARFALASRVSPLTPAAADPFAGIGGAGRMRTGGSALRLPGADRRAGGLGRAALALDAAAIRALLADAVAAEGIEAAWDEVARPVLVAVAERWRHDGAGVEIEHLLTDCMLGVFGALADGDPRTRSSPGPVLPDPVWPRPVLPRSVLPRPILLSAMPAERHTLPLAVLAAALAQRGLPCRSLGADLPADALAAAIRRTAPAAVVLWAQVGDTADGDVLAALPNTRPRFRTFVAGPGWADVALPARVARLDSLRAAVRALADAVPA
jgi:MerR family transcriptional regulator, light-induced transcriptional regulator